MADLTLTGKNNQKKKSCAFASALISVASGATPSDTLFNLPRAALVTNVYAIVTDAADVGDTIDIKVGTTMVANEIDISATGVASGTVTTAYFGAGGSVTAVAGDGAAVGADCAYKIVVEYIETEAATGEYTV